MLTFQHTIKYYEDSKSPICTIFLMVSAFKKIHHDKVSISLKLSINTYN